MNERDQKLDDQDCVCDYAESGLCSQCSGSGTMPEKEVTLGGCYHTGLAYALGYDVNGEVELCEKLFTNCNIGLGGGAMAALMKHRQEFDPSRDVEQFIVALKPVKIMIGREENEDYELGDNAGCDNCGVNDRVDGEVWCQDCIDDDICSGCDEQRDDCCCDDYDDEYCGNCNSHECLCNDDDWDGFNDTDEFDQENVADTFSPMNAFTRARWLKAQERL